MSQHSCARQRGVALLIVVFLGIGLLAISLVSIQMALAHGVARVVQREAFEARQIAESGAAQALSRIREGGFLTPWSGGGAAPAWVSFGSGAYYYYCTYDGANEVSAIRAWGRIAAAAAPSSCSAAPDSSSWDGTGWFVKGIQITVQGGTFIPEVPLFFGNGGIEKPLGGFDWTGSANLADPSTWGVVLSSPASWQGLTVPFESSALDHPVDYIYNGGTPAAASTYPHPYKMWASQNPIGQFNIEAWFKNSAGLGIDATVGLTPPPTTAFYCNDPSCQDYVYPINPEIPDVQSFAFDLWNKYQSTATNLGSGNRSGTYGDLSSPGVTFVTGNLTVPAGQTFQGAGVLVIRDNYDPNTQTNNTPSTKASLVVNGTFKWTGLVIIAGWAPDVTVDAGGNATIVGSLFGEDSVQSGGEVSLDSATISLKVSGPMKVLYSNALFRYGGLIHDFLPKSNKIVAAIMEM